MASRSLVVSAQNLSGACGVRHLSNYLFNDPHNFYLRTVRDAGTGGCGWVSGGFVNTDVCKATYDELTRLYGPPVFQTNARKNQNSYRKFFFAIWDGKKKKKKK